MAVLPLPPEINDLIGHCDVIVFDGTCVLCSGFFRFVLKHDQQERFCFVIAQSELGEDLYERLGLKSKDYDTNIVMRDGEVFTKLDAIAASVGVLGGVWSLARALRLLPRPVSDWFYDRIARNRFVLFGRAENCMLPSPEIQARFLG